MAEHDHSTKPMWKPPVGLGDRLAEFEIKGELGAGVSGEADD